jgi:pimeloyl-ACP methyl ester carboxylesterase
MAWAMTAANPCTDLKFRKVKGQRIAYIDEGQGDAIVFAHGNPTSSYVWRNVMPHLEGLGRLVACDLIGMGGSRNIPIDGEPAEVVAIVGDYAGWLSESEIPKLFINGELGGIATGRVREFIRTRPNQTEITVNGVHFLQEDDPNEIGAAIAHFVRRLRASAVVTGDRKGPCQ